MAGLALNMTNEVAEIDQIGLRFTMQCSAHQKEGNSAIIDTNIFQPFRYKLPVLKLDPTKIWRESYQSKEQSFFYCILLIDLLRKNQRTSTTININMNQMRRFNQTRTKNRTHIPNVARIL